MVLISKDKLKKIFLLALAYDDINIFLIEITWKKSDTFRAKLIVNKLGYLQKLQFPIRFGTFFNKKVKFCKTLASKPTIQAYLNLLR